jgi:hypothetical protein
MNARRLGAIAIVLFGLFAAGLAALRDPPPDEPVIDEQSADTGMSYAQREALMRTIGYVQ